VTRPGTVDESDICPGLIGHFLPRLHLGTLYLTPEGILRASRVDPPAPRAVDCARDKRDVLVGDAMSGSLRWKGGGDPMPEEKHVFTASRLTRGNLWFPVRIEVSQERVARVKPRLVGANEESIPISKVASVNISTGLIWSDIRIDSSGGSNPILSHGHRKNDARRIRDLIEGFQKGT
jgi:hypothetical protein